MHNCITSYLNRQQNMENTESRAIYIMISSTPTKFAHLIRLFGRVQYNHAAIALDADLNYLYAFARPQHKALLLGRLVRESLERYTLRKNVTVPVVVFRLPVTSAEYQYIESTIYNIQQDREYMYNLFSVITFPFFKGFETYKAFSCIEFVTYLLKKLNYPLSKPCFSYKPDDLLNLLTDNIIYQGDIRNCLVHNQTDCTYFAPLTMEAYAKSVNAIWELLKRFCYKTRYMRLHKQS